MRLGAFIAVGVIGFIVQMAALGGLLAAGCPYLAATALSIEITVVHNFVWHERWTWADRMPRSGGVLRRFFRFNAATGSVSLAGGVAMTATLVRCCGADPPTANALAVLLTAALNFAVADRWVFFADVRSRSTQRPQSAQRIASTSSSLCSP